MKEIKVSKITLNVGAGKDPARLTKGVKLLTNITGKEPVKTFTKKRIPTWGLRPGLPIGCKITLRKGKASALLPKLLSAKDNKLSTVQFDNEGNIAFGIHEYINIPDVNYDPEIGLMGLQVCITLERPGFRIKKRKLQRKRIPKHHKISRDEAMKYLSEQYKISVGSEE